MTSRDERDDTRGSVSYQLGGWGHSVRLPKRRGGMWSRYTFDTLKEARAEQRKQLRDQAWKAKQRALAIKKDKNPRDAMYRWGDDFGHTFPIFKVTMEFCP